MPHASPAARKMLGCVEADLVSEGGPPRAEHEEVEIQEELEECSPIRRGNREYPEHLMFFVAGRST